MAGGDACAVIVIVPGGSVQLENDFRFFMGKLPLWRPKSCMAHAHGTHAPPPMAT
jgi:hypothetical protein